MAEYESGDFSIKIKFRSAAKRILSLWGIRNIGQYGRFLIIRRQLEKIKFNRVLDAGCGPGLYAEYIAANFPVAEIVAVDLKDSGYNFSEKITFLSCDLRKITFNERFDLILNIDVLEHIDDYMAVLNNFYNALQCGGILVMHTPNCTPRRFFKYFEGCRPEEHIRIGFSKDQLIRDMQGLGFDVECARYTFGAIGNLAWELYHLTDEYKLYFKLMILPLLKLMMYYDNRKNHKIGNGLFLVARKPYSEEPS